MKLWFSRYSRKSQQKVQNAEISVWYTVKSKVDMHFAYTEIHPFTLLLHVNDITMQMAYV